MLRLAFALFLAVPAAAQVVPRAPDAPSPDVIGLWELVSAVDVPADDALVFVRLAITADKIRAVYVYLDPDDGELSGRFDDGRYVVSNGQLVIRDGRSTTVWDAARDGTLLRVRDIESGVGLLLREADPSNARDPALLGAWEGVRDGERFAVEFRADGTAVVRRGDDLDTGDYTVAGAYVLLGDEPARYTFRRGADGTRQLVVEADREETVLDAVAPHQGPAPSR
ncbi:hypothetical protein [Rubrivirga sp. IMCC45206]|uniref:hypothetical protein n=1 Tax=Rubrivirga sp. IMCC45206 TaxID=3391614 RepID=UPI0039903187